MPDPVPSPTLDDAQLTAKVTAVANQNTLTALGEADPVHQFTGWLGKFASYNRYFVIAAVLASALVGCSFLQSKTKSPISGQVVTRDVLAVEANEWVAKEKAAFNAYVADASIRLAAMKDKMGVAVTDLDNRDQTKAAIFGLVEKIASMAAPALGPAAPFVPIALSILGIGAVGDNIRKRGVINRLTDPEEAAKAATA